MGKVVADGLVSHGAVLAQHVTVYDLAVQQRLAGLQGAGLPKEAMLQLQVQSQALVMSFEDGFRLAMMAILAGLLLVLMLRKASGPAPAGAH
jgi:DHA2 family multidrug resistance protein